MNLSYNLCCMIAVMIAAVGVSVLASTVADARVTFKVVHEKDVPVAGAAITTKCRMGYG